MALIQTPSQPFKVDVDEYILQDAIDTNLSDFLKFLVTDAAGYVTLQAKAGDIRLMDADDSDASDIIQFTCDDADGGVLQKTSQITDGNIWEIRATGTISGAAATADIDYLHLDLDALILNDGAANAITLQAIDIDFNGLTATAVTLSNLTGITLDLPNAGIFNSEIAMNIIADKSAESNNVIALQISRDVTGDLGADKAISNFITSISQISTNDTTGDFDLTDTATTSGLMKLQMSQSDLTSVAKTDQDLMRGTVLLIDIDAVTNHAQAKLDMTARAIDITYTLTETLGTLRMGSTDIFRITPTIPTGLSSAAGFQFDLVELNLDNIVANDANLTLNAIYIDASDLTNTASSAIRLISAVAPDDSNIDEMLYLIADTTTANSTQNIETSRDINGTVAGAVALTNYANIFGQAVDHSGGDFIVTQTASTAGIMSLVMAHSTTLDTTAPDVFASTALNIDIDATANSASADLDANPRAVDIAYTLTETAGTLRWASTDIFRIDFNTSGTLSSAGAASINMLLLDAIGVTINDSNVSLDGLQIDMTSLTLTDASSLHGIEVTMPTLVGQATTRYGAYINDGTVTAKMVDGSMGVTATGINDEKYYRCEDFDEEAAAVTLDAGLRGDEWTFGGTNGDAGDVTYIQGTGGLIQLETDGADDDSVYALWLNTAVNITANPIIEFRVRIDSVAANMTGFAVGLAETGTFTTMAFDAVDDDYILVTINSDTANPANLKLYTEDNNGGITTADLAVAMTANVWCTIRIDCTDTEQPRIFVNNTGGAISPAHEIAAATVGAGTIQAGIYMYPVIFVQCLDATPSARHIDVDYIKIWQDRS